MLAFVASAWAQGDGAASQDVAAPTIAGTWEGRIETPPPLEVVVRFDLAADVAFGTIDIPAQGAFLIPLEAIEVDGDAVRLVIAGVPGEPTFAGTLDAERLAGTFSQRAGPASRSSWVASTRPSQRTPRRRPFRDPGRPTPPAHRATQPASTRTPRASSPSPSRRAGRSRSVTSTSC